jgi:hypothetical protein
LPKTCLESGLQAKIDGSDETFSNIPFLGINRVISMKKSVDPHFRSR